MEQIATILQGGYAYLLIFQILVVSSLFVMLIGMIIRRLRAENQPVGVGAGAPASDGVSLAEYEKLKATLAELEADQKNIEKLKLDNVALAEKVKFLESKLLEYEILQEEIGSLSNLKVENEKLKKELLALQADMSKTGAAITQMAQEPVVPAVVPSPEASASAAAMVSEFQTEKLEAEPTAIVPEAGVVPSNPEPSAPPTPNTAAANAGPTDAPNLDGLLAEIDALSAQAGNSNEAAK